MSRAPAPGERLLIVLPSWLGDLVQSEPALRAVAERVGTQRLSLAGEAHLLPVLDGAIEGARRIPHPERAAARTQAWRGHHLALLLPGSFRSAWTAWRAGIPRRVGWARDGRGLLLTDGASPALERGRTPLSLGCSGRGRRVLPRPFGATCVELVGRIGIQVADTRPRLALSQEGVGRVEARLGACGLGGEESWILASVGSRPGSAKAFPTDSWARTLSSVARQAGLPVAVCGGPGEEPVVREVAAACEAHGQRVLSLMEPAPDLSELRALCARASLVLCADGGARHVAMAMGTPVMWVAGPSDPRHSADHLEPCAPLRTRVPCGPCHLERCPLQGSDHHRCMGELDPEQLATRALSLLE